MPEASLPVVAGIAGAAVESLPVVAELQAKASLPVVAGIAVGVAEASLPVVAGIAAGAVAEALLPVVVPVVIGSTVIKVTVEIINSPEPQPKLKPA
ncbi:hypothetical protein [Limnospira fusiformis]|uniref:hypothetical protein n=1 Tax=Limnospira fusiformis TaxID=54297 RepID=UPI0014498A5B|nr:hypothetical protein HFV01_06910 [Limnospira fusiformis SAG 85.79]